MKNGDAVNAFHSAGFTARFTPTEPGPNFPHRRERRRTRTGGMLIGVATCSVTVKPMTCLFFSRDMPIRHPKYIDQAALTAVVLRLRVGDGGLVVDGGVGVGVRVGDVAVRPAVRHHVVRRDGHHGGDGVVFRQHASTAFFWHFNSVRCSCCAVSQVTAGGARTLSPPPRPPRRPLRSPERERSEGREAD